MIEKQNLLICEKKNTMGMKKNIALFASAFMMLSCRLSDTSSMEGSQQRSEFNPVLVKILKSNSLHAYEVAGLYSDSKGKSICSYPIVRDFGKLNRSRRNVLTFILSDVSLYESEYQPIKQPFSPSLVFKFSQKSPLSCLISFGTEEIAFSTNDSTYTTYRLTDVNNLKRFYKELSTSKQIKR